MKFNSQICTSREQSERLLAMGLKKETADMVYRSYGYIIDEFGDKERRFRQPTIRNTEDYEGKYDIPAWSLHRLIEIMGANNIQHWLGLNVERDFDLIIDTIEELIKEGYFNKEYLED